ncbi:N-acetylmuramoyl-L-alanine amidase [Listeria grandensis]|uniref:N-acetylmuramoyl-L-alanine amidase n=1 Tax=Listeria grandensis TaxID=1494963 RepID=UPI00164E6E56|nr:N-acetylmuramoyl-L-alanine amidase [Listeria grandensis]MBC6315422.1 SH3 domain-containing protein [Listeria grandensis]
MKNKFLFITVLSFLLIAAGVLSTIAMANANTVQVKAEVLNVRSGPGLAFDVTSQVRKDEILNVIDEENKWYKVRLSDGQSGYVASWLVKNIDVSASSNSLATVTSDGSLNVRSKPSTNAKILGSLKGGDQITVTSQSNGWTQIQYQGQTAWINSSYIKMQESATKESKNSLQTLTIRSNGTNIRSGPSRNNSTVEKADSGTVYNIDGVQGDWYQITTSSGQQGYVANWVVDVSNSKTKKAAKSKTTSLAEATIVIDPGHGGNDPGAKGKNGTIEKKATLKTAKAVAARLEQSGAKVILTRSRDEYISLKDRAKKAEKYNADAFVSIHFDSVEDASDSSVNGQTTYYYKNKDQSLAESINESLASNLSSKNRGTRSGDFYVLRENTQPSVLLELGYLSSTIDEQKMNSDGFHEEVANSIYEGLSNYFKN